MRYLESFTLPDDRQEGMYLMSQPPELEAPCYDTTNAYPFKLFAQKGLHTIDFSDVTVFYGGNGSGKSTLLNLIAEKLRLRRSAPFNTSPCMEAYLSFCRYGLRKRFDPIASESAIITSDGVFDFLLDIRTMNDEGTKQREALFEDFKGLRKAAEGYTMESLADYETLKQMQEVRKHGAASYVAARTPRPLPMKSNGESAFLYFTQKIGENAIYLLDEPENSLSPRLQRELLRFLTDSVRFYGCQFIISTHSPFLLSMPGAEIYDLDARPVTVRAWTELENVRAYYDFFKAHERDFHEITST